MTYVCPSNFHFDIEGAPIELALRLAFLDAPGAKVAGYGVTPAEHIGDRTKFVLPRLTLHWSVADASAAKVVAFPSPLTCDQTIPVVQAWLDGLHPDALGPRPDIDGDLKRGGVRVRSCPPGGYALCSIEPVWLEFHK